MLAIAAINQTFLLIRNHIDQSLRESLEEGVQSITYMSARPLSGAFEDLSADDATDIAVDSAKSWLFDAYAKKRASAYDDGDIDLLSTALHTLRQYSTQGAINDLWNRCYWQGWRLKYFDGNVLCVPEDVALETKLEAGCIRHTQNFIKFRKIMAYRAMSPKDKRENGLPRTVTQVASGRRRRIRVGKPSYSPRKLSYFFLECADLEASYLQFLLDRPFPQEPRLTCRLLVQTWHVILDLAEGLIAVPWRLDGPHKKVTENTALLIPRSELVGILSDALTVDQSVADAAVSFLTFKVKTAGDKGHRGLWSAPIVRIPESDNVALALPVLAFGNAMRKVESWLEKAGIDDSLSRDARGNVYEVEYRKRICDAIAGNDILKEAICAEQAIKKDSKFGEQIDLLIRLGPLLIVAEVKCWLFPANSIERYYQLKKLRKAADQARRKADALRKRPDVAAKSLGLSLDICGDLRVIPLVVSNQGFGFSLNFDGCLVTDAGFLERYLRNGILLTSYAVDFRTGADLPVLATQYDTESQAAVRIEKELSDPAVMQQFEERISWHMMPSRIPIEHPILHAAARLGNLNRDETLYTEMLIAEL